MRQLSVQALFCFTAALSLAVFDPTWRLHLEAAVWVLFVWLPPLFFLFSVTYTGRTSLLASRVVRATFLLPIGLTILALSHPVHDLLWTDVTLVPLFGTATLAYQVQPVGLIAMSSLIIYPAVGVFLLVDTIIDYGPLYRREAAAVAVSTLPPTAAFFYWILDLGPLSTVNLVALLFLPHVALDAYAFVGKNMFASSPTTMRVAEEHAIDNLPQPIVVLDRADRIIDYNEAAATLFSPGTDRGTTTLTEALPITLDETGEPAPRVQAMTADDSDRPRQFSISTTRLTDPADRQLGCVLILQDVTTEIEHQQQLEVLNRLLRHNLRNELTVVMGAAETLESELSDPELQSWLTALKASGRELVDIADRAREFSQLRDHEVERRPVQVSSVLEPAWATAREVGPATLEVALTDDARILTDPTVLEVVLRNLLENAIVHAPGASPTVTIRGDRDGDTYQIEIEDEGPGIPEEERRVLKRERETDLEHGSGLGLWLVTWGLERVGGAVTFECVETGTIATVTVPLATDDPP